MLVDSKSNFHKVPGRTPKLDCELFFKTEFTESEDIRQAALGNSFHTGTVALLLGTILHQRGWIEKVRDPESLMSLLVVEWEDFTSPDSVDMSERQAGPESPASPLSKLEIDEELLQLNGVQGDVDQVDLNKQLMTALVAQFFRRVEYRGSDIGLDSEVLCSNLGSATEFP